MSKAITTFFFSISLICWLGACANQSSKVAVNESAENPKGLPSFLKTDIPENSYQPKTEAAAVLTDADDSQTLVGTWRHGWINMPNCGSEHIFMSDGKYYGMGGCAGFVPLRTVGKWFFPQKGVIRITVTDWEPKYDQAGNPIQHPPGELFKYKFLDRNRMSLGDGSVIAYRVGN